MRGWATGLVLGALLLAGCSSEPEVDPVEARMRSEVGQARAALQAQPDSLDLYYDLARVFQRYSMSDSARNALERAVAVYPAFPQAHRDIAQLAYEAGDLEVSARHWAQVAHYLPEDLEAWNNLGFVRREIGDLAGAEAAYRQALEVDSTFAQTLNNLGQVYRAQDRLDDAVQLYHRAMAADPTFRGAYINLVNLYRETGQADAERRLLLEIRERFGQSSPEGRYATQQLMELDGR